jgi:MoxR-like ATPase
VLPDDVKELAVEVIAHRLVLSFDAVADGVSAESVVQRLIEAVPPPRIAPQQGDEQRRGLAAA